MNGASNVYVGPGLSDSWRSVHCIDCRLAIPELPMHPNGSTCYMADPESDRPICHCCRAKRGVVYDTVARPKVESGRINSMEPWL